MICPNCRCIVPSNLDKCLYCGFKFPDGKEKTIYADTYNKNNDDINYGYYDAYAYNALRYNNNYNNGYYTDNSVTGYDDNTCHYFRKMYNRQNGYAYNENPYLSYYDNRSRCNNIFYKNLYNKSLKKEYSNDFSAIDLILLLLAGTGCVLLLIILALLIILL